MNAGTATTAGVNMDPAQLLTLAFQISITLTVFVFGLGQPSRMSSTSSAARGCW
jgi:hypothetical protein